MSLVTVIQFLQWWKCYLFHYELSPSINSNICESGFQSIKVMRLNTWFMEQSYAICFVQTLKSYNARSSKPISSQRLQVSDLYRTAEVPLKLLVTQSVSIFYSVPGINARLT